jgi:hypothetical protein
LNFDGTKTKAGTPELEVSEATIVVASEIQVMVKYGLSP